MTSVKDVAQLAGVSLMTVSRALNNPEKLSPETLQRVRRAIDELQFVPSWNVFILNLLAASVFQNPHDQATTALQAALKMIKGQPVESDMWVPYELITPEQVPEFQARFK